MVIFSYLSLGILFPGTWKFCKPLIYSGMLWIDNVTISPICNGNILYNYLLLVTCICQNLPICSSCHSVFLLIHFVCCVVRVNNFPKLSWYILYNYLLLRVFVMIYPITSAFILYFDWYILYVVHSHLYLPVLLKFLFAFLAMTSIFFVLSHSCI